MEDLMILHVFNDVFRVTTSEEGHLNRTQASSLIYSHLDHIIKNDYKWSESVPIDLYSPYWMMLYIFATFEDWSRVVFWSGC